MYEKNAFGDIIAVYTGEGVKQISYTYDAWGNFTTTYHNGATSSSIAAKNPYRYRGYYYDSETGLYYLRSRYYDPNVGRFINADGYISTGQGLTGYNMYAYCNNNPVMYVDPNGEAPWWAIAAVVTAVVVVTTMAAVPYVVAANIYAVKNSEQVVADTSIEPMDDEKFKSYADNTSGMTDEEQVAYIRKQREIWGAPSSKEADKLNNWSEADMLRELKYHDRAYRFLNAIGLGNSEWGERAKLVNFETEQTFVTYALRNIGNLMLW